MSRFYTLLCSLCFTTIAFAQSTNVLQSYKIERTSATEIEDFYDPEYFPFYHGVASGDPTPSSVIIWTRVTLDNEPTVDVNWEVASDIDFNNIIASGVVQTGSSHDFTVKVDVQNLLPYTYYYYRFKTGGLQSIIGRTKTAPAADEADQIKIGVFSCVNYQAGFFNAYANAVRFHEDIDVTFNLGDYLYEYETGGYGASSGTNRPHVPDTEQITLEDYRLRQSQYHMDPDLRRIHQMFPMIVTWDDHETTNDSYVGGAENHQPETEGDWNVRKNNAAQAYHEWMPIRTPDSTDQLRLWRQLKYGDLVEFNVLDTRIFGRDEPVSTVEESNDTSRSLLGPVQFNWMMENLQQSTAKWKVLAQQIMVMQFYNGPNQPFNFDAWDGYAAERNRVLSVIEDNNIDNLVVLTGDIHTSWAADLMPDPFNPTPYVKGGNDPVHTSLGVEFVTPSVTSDNFNEILGSPPGSSQGVEEAVKNYNTHIHNVELDDHGFMVVHFDEGKVQTDWYTNEILMVDSTTTHLMSYAAQDGNNFLDITNPEPIAPQASGAAVPAAKFVNQADTSTISIRPVEIQMISVQPNPFQDYISLQYVVNKTGVFNIEVISINGTVQAQQQKLIGSAGMYHLSFDAVAWSAGTYVLNVTDENGALLVSQKVVKQ